MKGCTMDENYDDVFDVYTQYVSEMA
jgi:hypothetical protein